MANAMNFSNWQGAWMQALALAWNDEDFRDALLADARAAIESHLHVELPGSFPVRVVEGGQGDHVREIALSVPPKSTEAKAEPEVLARYAREMLTDSSFACIC